MMSERGDLRSPLAVCPVGVAEHKRSRVCPDVPPAEQPRAALRGVQEHSMEIPVGSLSDLLLYREELLVTCSRRHEQ
jgi:hypothetical protein